ncbi:hypothetical protein VTH82DRAFT_6239 [Thermothelomyces myriococcoides]
MRFQAPQLGAMGVTFTMMRIFQFTSLITVIGLCANFINGIAATEHKPPAELIGTLTVEVTAIIYVVISYILYYDSMLPLLVAGILDSLLLVASIVVAALVGKPLAALDCSTLPSAVPVIATFFSTAHRARDTIITQTIPYSSFVALDQPTCYEIKAVWGLSIAQCVLFAFSGLVCGRAGAKGGSLKEAKLEPWNRAAEAKAPYFPPPPVAPIRDRGRGRGRSRQPRPPTPPRRRRRSCDSDDSAFSPEVDVSGSPQPNGLRPPPPVRTQPNTRLLIPDVGGNIDDDGISPVLSRAPPPLPPPPVPTPPATYRPPRLRIPTSTDTTATAPASSITTSSPPSSAADDMIPEEHKRIPRSPRSPRSPLSPIRNLGLGLGLGLGGFLTRRGTMTARRGQEGEENVDNAAVTYGGEDDGEEEEVLWVRRRMRRMRTRTRRPGPVPVPGPVPPIVIVHPPPAHAPATACTCGQACAGHRGATAAGIGRVASVRGSIVVVDNGSPGTDINESPSASGGPGEKKGRRTMWEMIDGWWDLGLLERMGTVRRKK